MSVEIRMLGWSIVLGLVYVFVAAGLATAQRGLKWNASNRDGDAPPLTGFATRAQRANGNFLETFGFFVAATLAVVIMHKTSDQTAVAVQLYVWARLAYLPIYVIGIPYVRTAVWVVSLWGILQLTVALF